MINYFSIQECCQCYRYYNIYYYHYEGPYKNLIKETSIYRAVRIISVTGVTLIEIVTSMTLFLLPDIYRSKYVIWQIQTYNLGNDLPPLCFFPLKIIFPFSKSSQWFLVKINTQKNSKTEVGREIDWWLFDLPWLFKLFLLACFNISHLILLDIFSSI